MTETVKESFLGMARILRGTDNYYFVKCIDVFDRLPIGHKRNFLTHLAEQTKIEKWKELSSDDTQYYNLMRSVLFYFSGREEFSEPCKHDLIKSIVKYSQSPSYKEVKVAKEAETFMEGIEDL